MAENIGGLSAAQPMEAEPTLPTDMKSMAMDAQKRYLEGQAKLDARREQLIAAMTSRKSRAFDPSLMRLAAGLLAPTKTGSFGESLGYGVAGMAEEQEKEFARQQQEAKLAYELEAAGLEQRQKMMGNQMALQYLQQRQAPQMPAGGAAPAGGAPSAAPAGGVSAGTPGYYQGMKLPTADELILMQQFNPPMAKMMEELLKREMEERKYALEAQKAGQQEVTVNMLDIGDVKVPFPLAQQYRQVAKQAAETGNKQILYKFYIDNGLMQPPERPDQAIPKPESAEEKAARAKELEVAGQERGKSSAAIKERFYTSAEQAPMIINASEAIYNLASDPKTAGAFGVLAKPGVKSAILSALSEGVRAGQTSISFPGIEEAVRKIGGTQAEIDAALMAARYLAELELGFRKSFLAGQGAVSNMEAEVTRRLGGSLADSPRVAMAKAEVLMARAKFDQQANKLMEAWEDKNPNAHAKKFKSTPEYERLVNEYNDHLKQLQNKYFPSTPTPQRTRTVPGSGRSMLEQLRGGE
jgi:hypothetical protein